MIKVENLSKRVETSEGELTILNGINLAVREGETVAIVGASGSGKSTLLGLMAGLDSASSGDVLLHALPIFHTHGLFVATNISLAAGGAMILLPGFDPEAILRWLPRATTMMGVPTFYTRLLDDPRFTRELRS